MLRTHSFAVLPITALLMLWAACSTQPVHMLAGPDAYPMLVIRDTIPPTDTTAQRILLIGDSMTKGIMHRLDAYCNANGHQMKTVIWVAGNTYWFARYDTLQYYMQQYQPTYVILVLGANELWVSRRDARRMEFVNRVAAKMRGVKHLWVGPPNWKTDAGINDMIQQAVGPRRYFESRKLQFERQADGMHVTRRASAIWTDSIVHFIQYRSLYPIRLTNAPIYPEKDPVPIFLLAMPE